MLAGRPAFAGRTVVEILHATLHEQPPALTGSPAIAAVDRVIRRALAKRPADRLASADVMAEELSGKDGDETPALAQALTRLVVLPFRVLRSDPETDFLAFSLPDAIATSLSGVGLILRPSAAAVRFAGETPDLARPAAGWRCGVAYAPEHRTLHAHTSLISGRTKPVERRRCRAGADFYLRNVERSSKGRTSLDTRMAHPVAATA